MARDCPGGRGRESLIYINSVCWCGGKLAPMDDDRTTVLRHRIETLRRYLAEGVTAEIATLYLQEIARAEAELALIDSPEPANR
jgi:hypothetical protein